MHSLASNFLLKPFEIRLWCQISRSLQMFSFLWTFRPQYWCQYHNRCPCDVSHRRSCELHTVTKAGVKFVSPSSFNIPFFFSIHDIWIFHHSYKFIHCDDRCIWILYWLVNIKYSFGTGYWCFASTPPLSFQSLHWCITS